jgi:hypothetical protein
MLYPSPNELAVMNRAKALDLQSKAMQSRDPQVRAGLLKIADTYDRMAADFEKKDLVVHFFEFVQTTRNYPATEGRNCSAKTSRTLPKPSKI